MWQQLQVENSTLYVYVCDELFLTAQVTCFKCRQPGHKVDDCPDRGKKEDVAGICFKCGSAEHTSRACRVAIGAGRFYSCKVCMDGVPSYYIVATVLVTSTSCMDLRFL